MVRLNDSLMLFNQLISCFSWEQIKFWDEHTSIYLVMLRPELPLRGTWQLLPDFLILMIEDIMQHLLHNYWTPGSVSMSSTEINQSLPPFPLASDPSEHPKILTANIHQPRFLRCPTQRRGVTIMNHSHLIIPSLNNQHSLLPTDTDHSQTLVVYYTCLTTSCTINHFTNQPTSTMTVVSHENINQQITAMRLLMGYHYDIIIC